MKPHPRHNFYSEMESSHRGDKKVLRAVSIVAGWEEGSCPSENGGNPAHVPNGCQSIAITAAIVGREGLLESGDCQKETWRALRFPNRGIAKWAIQAKGPARRV